MNDMIIIINGQTITQETIDFWELKRLKHQYHFFTKKGFTLNQNNLTIERVNEAREELTQLKTTKSPVFFRDLLKTNYSIGNFSSKVATFLSRGKRKYSVTEFVVSNSDMSSEEILRTIETIMLENTNEHLYQNLSTNPDHFVLISTGKKVQEVVEITGGSPFTTRFFAHYGDESGLTSTLSEGYTHQAAGAARLEDGTIIGGVRHQIKNEGTGFRFKALVEFPAILPNFMIKQHQYHLACEFRQWLLYAIKK